MVEVVVCNQEYSATVNLRDRSKAVLKQVLSKDGDLPSSASSQRQVAFASLKVPETATSDASDGQSLETEAVRNHTRCSKCRFPRESRNGVYETE